MTVRQQKLRLGQPLVDRPLPAATVPPALVVVVVAPPRCRRHLCRPRPRRSARLAVAIRRHAATTNATGAAIVGLALQAPGHGVSTSTSTSTSTAVMMVAVAVGQPASVVSQRHDHHAATVAALRLAWRAWQWWT